MAKTPAKNSYTETLSVAFSMLALVFLSVVVQANVPLEAMALHTAAISSSQASQLSDVQAAAGLRRLKRTLGQRSSSSSPSLKAAAPEKVFTRPGSRAIRANVAASDDPATRSVRPTVTLQKAGCGDGLVIKPEACDDGNTVSGDGCSSTCTFETGFDCDHYSQPTVCKERCGNGAVSPSETCDDGNTNNGDGCNHSCKLEFGYTCTSDNPNVCSSTCGDGKIAGDESCDDGNTASGDGCSSTCSVE